MISSCVKHEDAIIQHFIEDPELAEIMLQDAIAEGDIREVEKIQRRIDAAKSRAANLGYWGSLVDNAERTAKSGQNLDVLMTRAMDILKAAVPASA